MTTLTIITDISAGIEKCFDLARSIDVLLNSMSKSKERAIAGRLIGLCEAGDTITWEALHFGMKQKLTSEITKMNRPVFFEDSMMKGAFKSMRHEHHFREMNGKTIMTDVFIYETPFGIFGKFFNLLILKNYMKNLIEQRNQTIKTLAEKMD